jgi:hypothetical protein
LNQSELKYHCGNALSSWAGTLTGPPQRLSLITVTRLIWVLIFAVLVGALVLISLRSLPGTRVNRQLAQAEQARGALARLFPDSRFRVQFSAPSRNVRNLVVTIQPGRADSSEIAAQVDSTESVVRRDVDLSGYDSLVIVIFDRVYRSVPTR